jgi:hypothetical protein
MEELLDAEKRPCKRYERIERGDAEGLDNEA